LCPAADSGLSACLVDASVRSGNYVGPDACPTLTGTADAAFGDARPD
jgi:hypothetical protein